MSIVIDIVLVTVFLLLTFLGWKKGFILMLPKAVCTVLAAIGASFISGPISNALPYTDIVAKVVAYIISFLLIIILLSLARMILNMIFQLPVLKIANRLLGIILGVLLGAFYVWLISLLFIAILPRLCELWPDIFYERLISESYILNFLSQIDPLTVIKSLK